MKRYLLIIPALLVLIGAGCASSYGGRPSANTGNPAVAPVPAPELPSNPSPSPVVTPPPVAPSPATNPSSNLNTEPAPAPVTPTTTSPAPGAAKPATASVAIQNFSFSPATLTVKRGTEVTWTNNDSVPHRIVPDAANSSGGPQSGTLSQGDQFSFTFDKTGSFGYICQIHPSMSGTVIVTE